MAELKMMSARHKRRRSTIKTGLDADLLYTIEENPPWYSCFFQGLQHYLIMASSTITAPLIVAPMMCIAQDDPVRGHLVCTIIFVSGILTFLQCTFGCRLPIVQGCNFGYIIPTMAILHSSYAPCDSLPLANMTTEERTETWQIRMREIQGAIAVSAIFEVFLGFSGLMGILLQWITPLVIVPTITLVGLPLFDLAAAQAATNWPVSLTTVGLMILFSQYMRNIPIHLPYYKWKSGLHWSKFEIFKVLPLLLVLVIMWAACGIMTHYELLAKDSRARTDLSHSLVRDAPWFRIPYPGQFGRPTVTAAGVFGMLAAILASAIESIGDYHACARLVGAKTPPDHAINRGIGIEGIGTIIAGIMGTCSGTASYSGNIGAIAVTRVGSRRVMQWGALIMVIFGAIGKFGAFCVTLPDPVIGGLFFIIFPLIFAVGLSTLQYVDLNSPRNLFILGFSLFFGLSIPKWMEEHQNAIQTGFKDLDQLLTILLSTSMFVGGALGFILDNTVSGTDEERGLIKMKAEHCAGGGDAIDCYSLPKIPIACFWSKCWEYMPFSPNFGGWFSCRRGKSSNTNNTIANGETIRENEV